MTKLAKMSDAELVERLKLLKAHGTSGKAAAVLGISSSTFRTSIAEARARGLSADSKVLDEAAKLKTQVKLLQRQLEKIQKDNDTAESIRQHIYNLSVRPPEPPKWTAAPAVNRSRERGAPVVLFSDWHRGEVVRAEEVAGVNEFNSDIHDRRVKKLVEKIIDLSFNHMGRAKTVYPGIVVNLGGDFINGDIHGELVDTGDRTTQQNINELTDVLAAAIETLATAFGHAFVPCVVGNHGRASLKPRMKGRVFTSHEWNIYCNLERYFRASKNIRFLIPGETDARYNIYGHRYLLTHGDSLGVKGGDGIIGAIGPIMRGAMKVGRSEAQIGRDFDTLLMGHWHQALWLPGVIVNNSLKGYDEFARLALRAPYSRPSQMLWFTHPEHGITAHWEVFLEPKRQATDAEWITFQRSAA